MQTVIIPDSRDPRMNSFELDRYLIDDNPRVFAILNINMDKMWRTKPKTYTDSKMHSIETSSPTKPRYFLSPEIILGT